MKWRAGNPLTLLSENYVMRSLEPRFVPADIDQWFADPKIMQYVNMPMNMSVEAFISYLGSFNNRTKLILGIWDRKTKKLIGFYRVYINAPQLCAVTSVVIGDLDYWGRGAVVETRTKLIDFLLLDLGLHKITAKVKARNFAAVFNYKKLGFVKEGVRRQHIKDGKGGWLDVVAFGLLQDEWREIRNIAKKEGQS